MENILIDILTKYSNDFHYNENKIPTLKEAKVKIVIFTGNSNLESWVKICECAEYGNGGSSSNGDICYSLIMNDIYGIQVNYNLEKDDKWTIRVPSIIICKLRKDFTKTEDSFAIQILDCGIDENTNQNKKKKKNKIYNNSFTDKFHDTNYKEVLTIDFMNITRMDDPGQ
ncbi:hypothetical protein H8356DRAFT_1353694 [Neocallimastix lanati (nom. inval.)]|nr:hypothetical protein H8356DRAFT_1353694 [Neocallimastix sp. JGI-2020a]